MNDVSTSTPHAQSRGEGVGKAAFGRAASAVAVAAYPKVLPLPAPVINDAHEVDRRPHFPAHRASRR